MTEQIIKVVDKSYEVAKDEKENKYIVSLHVDGVILETMTNFKIVAYYDEEEKETVADLILFRKNPILGYKALIELKKLCEEAINKFKKKNKRK